MAVASLVLGIVAIVAGFFGLGFPVGALCGIVGIVLGVLGKKNVEKAGIAKAGFICSIIGTVLSLLFFIACASCVGGLAGLSLLQ